MKELFGATLLLNKEKIIFSHDFAKAFWGIIEDIERDHDDEGISLFAWQYHFEKIVLEKDRLKYLERYL